MKLTSRILLTMLCLFVGGLFAANAVFKKELEKVDKSDLYWNYARISETPFHHIHLEGGNITLIAFEENPKTSVRVYKQWKGFDEGKVKAIVKHDTLYLDFQNTYSSIGERDWMKWNKLVRIFAPEILSVTGNNTNFEMFKTHQKSIRVQLKGKSSFEMESMVQQFDSLFIQQQDSSAVVFEMAPEFKVSESFHVNWVDANIKGYSILDIGHGQVDSLRLSIADSSGILLSGGTLKKR